MFWIKKKPLPCDYEFLPFGEFNFGAGKGIRTLDPHHGKVMLYH